MALACDSPVAERRHDDDGPAAVFDLPEFDGELTWLAHSEFARFSSPLGKTVEPGREVLVTDVIQVVTPPTPPV